MNASVGASREAALMTSTEQRVAEGVRERPLLLGCGGESLMAVLAEPVAVAGDTGLVIVVGGPQYRAGSHRQFVLLARCLARSGFAVLRFDVRGMGDSGGDARGFEALDDDIDAAIDALCHQAEGVRRVVLWGLCDGASAALLHARRRRDPRVAALCLLNPWLRSDAGLARAHVKHYYASRLREWSFWRKLLTGGVGLGAVQGLLGNVRRAFGAPAAAAQPVDEDFRTGMARGWAGFTGPVLLILSGRDLTAREFVDGISTSDEWRGALQRPNVSRVDLPDADHTFSSERDRLDCECAVADWLSALRGDGARP